MTEAVQDAVLPSINGTSRASKSSLLGSPYSWPPVFDSGEPVPKLMALDNEHACTHTLCSCAKQDANCLRFCLHFFENCVALICINFYVGQHCDQFVFRNDSTCHLVPLANSLKNSIKKFFHAAPQEKSGFFFPFSSHLRQ